MMMSQVLLSELLCSCPVFCEDEVAVFNLKPGVYVPLNKPSFKYERMMLTSNTISWRNGPKGVKYRIIDKASDLWIAEFSKPLPEIYGITYRYMLFNWVEAELGYIGIALRNTLPPADDETGLWFSYAPYDDTDIKGKMI
jgi:hypothetical protein